MARTTSSAREYIIPAPFDPRLMEVRLLRRGQGGDGFGRGAEADRGFRRLSPAACAARLNPTTSVLTQVYEDAKANPKRVVFAEAEEEVVLRAAIQFRDFGYGTPVLVGRTQAVLDKLRRARRWPIRTASRSRTRPTSEHVPADGRLSLRAACSGAAIPSATCAAWSTRSATSSPRCWSRWAMAMR